MLPFLQRRWFLLALTAALAVGMLFHAALAPLGDARILRQAIVASVLFLMALPVESKAMWHALRHPWAPMLATAINLGVLPLLAWPVALTLPRDAAAGLLIASVTPCTLASAAVWTRRAGGNDSVAVMVTIVTNLLCFLITPVWLDVMLGDESLESPFDLWATVQELAMLVVLPIFTAQALRRWKPLADWTGGRKIELAVAAQLGILMMILIGAINLGEKVQSHSAGAAVALDWLAIIAAVSFVHVAALGLGHALAALTGVSREDRIAVGFAGSQKTLMVGLQISLDFGVTILPMVAYHVGQLLIDTLVADRLRGNGATSLPSDPMSQPPSTKAQS